MAIRSSVRMLPVLILAVTCTLAIVRLTACGHPDTAAQKSDTTRSVLGPAPDNNSANNPSLADTMYQRDSTRSKRSDTPARSR